MTLAEFAKGTTTFVVVIVAGLLSETYLDRHFAATDTHQQATDGAEASSPSTSPLRTVVAPGAGQNGSMQNGPWRGKTPPGRGPTGRGSFAGQCDATAARHHPALPG